MKHRILGIFFSLLFSTACCAGVLTGTNSGGTVLPNCTLVPQIEFVVSLDGDYVGTGICDVPKSNFGGFMGCEILVEDKIEASVFGRQLRVNEDVSDQVSWMGYMKVGQKIQLASIQCSGFPAYAGWSKFWVSRLN